MRCLEENGILSLRRCVDYAIAKSKRVYSLFSRRTSTGRFRCISGVGMLIKSHLYISQGLDNASVTARTVSFIDHMRSMCAFVFEVQRASDLSFARQQ